MLVILLLFFLSSCQGPACPWKYQSLCSRCPDYRTFRMGLPYDPFKPCEISPEFYRTGGEAIALQLNLHARPLKPRDALKQEVPVELWVGERLIECKGTVLKGGQRVLLNHQIAFEAASALRQGMDIRIRVASYDSTIPAGNAKELLSRLDREQVQSIDSSFQGELKLF